MKLYKKLLNTVAIILCFAVFSFAQTDWMGEYEFGEDGGETAGGSKIYIAHTIKITEKAGKLDSHLYSQGFQTSRDIYADVKIVGDKIELYFREKGEDQYTSIYKKGDLLLTIERKTVDGKTKFLTYWSAFTPMLDANEKDGEVYFVKPKKVSEKKVSEKKVSENKSIDDEWIRYETKNKGVSFAFPPNTLFNNEKTKYVDSTVYGFKDGATLNFNIYNKSYNKRRVFRSNVPDLTNVQRFKIGRYVVSQRSSISGAKRAKQTYIIASDKEYYIIDASANSVNNPSLLRFLRSIKIAGTLLFKQDDNNNLLEKTVSLEDTETSQEILDAIKRKTVKAKRNVSYDLRIGGVPKVENKTEYSRQAIIISRPRPKFPSSQRQINGGVTILMEIELLANGQVGDILFIQAPSEKYAKDCCVETIKDLKFVPAQIDGKNVDSTQIITYSFSVYIFRNE